MAFFRSRRSPGFWLVGERLDILRGLKGCWKRALITGNYHKSKHFKSLEIMRPKTQRNIVETKWLTSIAIRHVAQAAITGITVLYLLLKSQLFHLKITYFKISCYVRRSSDEFQLLKQMIWYQKLNSCSDEGRHATFSHVVNILRRATLKPCFAKCKTISSKTGVGLMAIGYCYLKRRSPPTHWLIHSLRLSDVFGSIKVIRNHLI